MTSVRIFSSENSIYTYSVIVEDMEKLTTQKQNSILRTTQKHLQDKQTALMQTNEKLQNELEQLRENSRTSAQRFQEDFNEKIRKILQSLTDG